MRCRSCRAGHDHCADGVVEGALLAGALKGVLTRGVDERWKEGELLTGALTGALKEVLTYGEAVVGKGVVDMEANVSY